MNVDICIGSCSHMRDSGSVLSFVKGLPINTKKRININYKTCRNCGNGPRVKVGNTLIFKANPEKIMKTFIQKNIPISIKSIKNY